MSTAVRAPQAPPLDPTLPTPEQQAAIEAAMGGFSLRDADPALLDFLVQRCRQAGNTAFKEKRYKEAVQMYSQAVAGAPDDAALFANRSAAYLSLGLYEQAAWDGRKAAALRPGWAKAHYRLGCALLALSSWGEAAAALRRALELEPGCADVAARLGEAEGRAGTEAAARAAQAATERRALAAKLRAARRADQRLAQLNQFKQAMTGPDWELEDLEWRPTFLPAMRLKPVSPQAAFADPRARLLASYRTALADLAAPKAALRTLEDVPRLLAFQRGIQAALATQPPDAHVLVLEAGGGVLPLLAAGAGAGSVTAVERSRMLYRMARQVLESNCGRGGAQGEAARRVSLLDRRLQAVGVAGEAPPPDVVQARRERAAAGAAAAALPEDDGGALLPRRASLLVTDLLDHSVLGLGLLPALDYAAERLLAPGAAVVPGRVRVMGALLELRVGQVSGFDLSALNAYWWHPGTERLDLARMPHRRLSAPFELHLLDLQARLAARQAAACSAAGAGSVDAGTSGGSGDAGAGGGSDASCSAKGSDGGGGTADAAWELDREVEVAVTADGEWNAVVLWMEVHAGGEPGATLTSWRGASDGPAAASSGSSSEGGGGNSTAAARCHATSSHAHAACPPAPAEAASWGQGVQYVDARAVKAGAAVRLRVRHDAGQFVVTSQPPQCRPRHALAPRWHYDMVLDQQRNDAYEGAIRRAVVAKRAAGQRHILALDVGAGTGLLSMMAARAGADEVVAAEISQHMCDVGEETVLANGYFGRIVMLDRDARRLDVLRKPDGTPPDLPRRADLLVYEVFDSGCIGEGVLHLVTAARAKLLAEDAAMVPIAARVFCQPIQLRVGEVLGWDAGQANRWRWRPDYEGMELGACRDQWVPLAEPVEVFTFDFQHAAAHMTPEEAALDLRFTAGGVFNAVAMWFELQLDEEATLSTSPYYSDKGLTWQQAVQWMPEVAVAPGQRLTLTARHDTYSISYALPPGMEAAAPDGSTVGDIVELGSSSTAGGDGSGCAAGSSSSNRVPGAGGQPRRNSVPLCDPAWQAAFERLHGLNSQLVKACVQNPLEYRAVAQAALRLAARPHDLGVDPQQAADFCVKLMG